MTLHDIAYGCVYLLGFVLFAAGPSSCFSRRQCILLAIWAADGAILGGRLGYCLVYEPHYYAQHLEEILQLWRGGMSYHGGALGLILGIYCYARWANLTQTQMWKAYDRAALCALIVIPCGRICNFYNGELWGRVTDLPWGVYFAGADPLPRHPVQLYEALAEGPVLALILYICLRRLTARPGVIACLYLIGYSSLRFMTEFVREPDRMIGFVGGLTLGQWLCILSALLGAGLLREARASHC
ncbi:MAG: prolipoprotein diacylglyceryl transferase [Succinivibrio sp.]|nr:prolipoprotein diacylglyceryl transferase [Succinivibrio sp.]